MMDNSPDKESPDAPTQLRALANDKMASTRAYARDLRRAADEIERLREALTLIERIYYMEAKRAEWRGAHMNGVARDALSPEGNFAWARRLFPRSEAAEIYAQR